MVIALSAFLSPSLSGFLALYLPPTLTTTLPLQLKPAFVGAATTLSRTQLSSVARSMPPVVSTLRGQGRGRRGRGGGSGGNNASGGGGGGDTDGDTDGGLAQERRALCINYVHAAKMFLPDPERKWWEIRNAIPKCVQPGNRVIICASAIKNHVLDLRDDAMKPYFEILGSAIYRGAQIIETDEEFKSHFLMHRVQLDVLHSMQRRWTRKTPVALKFDSFQALPTPIRFFPRKGAGVMWATFLLDDILPDAPSDADAMLRALESPDGPDGDATASHVVHESGGDDEAADAPDGGFPTSSHDGGEHGDHSSSDAATDTGTIGDVDESDTDTDTVATSASSDNEQKRDAQKIARRKLLPTYADVDMLSGTSSEPTLPSPGPGSYSDSDSDQHSHLPLLVLPGQRLMTDMFPTPYQKPLTPIQEEEEQGTAPTSDISLASLVPGASAGDIDSVGGNFNLEAELGLMLDAEGEPTPTAEEESWGAQHNACTVSSNILTSSRSGSWFY